MISVRSMLRNKKIQSVIKVGPETTVITAANVMANEDIGSLIVEKDGILLGLVTDRDLTTKVLAVGEDPNATPVAKIMTKANRIISVTMEADIEDCITIMDKGHFRHLAIVEEGAVLGVISIKDVAREILAGGVLSDHIHGSGFSVS